MAGYWAAGLAGGADLCSAARAVRGKRLSRTAAATPRRGEGLKVCEFCGPGSS